jgi:hypothetical protein
MRPGFTGLGATVETASVVLRQDSVTHFLYNQASEVMIFINAYFLQMLTITGTGGSPSQTSTTAVTLNVTAPVDLLC